MKKIFLAFSLLALTSTAMAELDVTGQDQHVIEVAGLYHSMEDCQSEFDTFINEQLDTKQKVIIKKQSCEQIEKTHYVRAKVKFIR